MLNRLPKAAGLMLGIGKDLFDTGHRVAEHLSFDDFFKELGFGDALEKISDGRFHSIDLFLADLGDIKSFPIFLFQKIRRHAFAIHPFDQRLVGSSAGLAAVNDEVEIAVLAWPENPHTRSGNPPPGNERASTLFQLAVEIPERMGVGERPEQTSLRRDIDLLSLTGELTMIVCDQRAHRSIGAGPAVGLWKRNTQRRTIRIAGQRHAAARCHDFNIRGFELAVGSGLTKRRDRRKHQPRIDLGQCCVAQIESIEIARRESLDHEIRFGNELSKELAPSGRLQVESDAALVVIETKPEETLFRIGLITIERPQSSCRLTAGWFDLDNIRAQIS